MATKSSKLNQEQKDFVIKILAQHFVQYGFGYPKGKEAVMKRLNYQLLPNCYNNYMTTIVRFTFRFLEDFLVSKYQKTIRPITHAEEKVIRSPMLQCRRWMSQQILQTFFKIILLAHKYADSTPNVTINQANLLYNQLIDLIKNRPDKVQILKEKKKLKETQNLEESMNRILPKRKNQSDVELKKKEQFYLVLSKKQLSTKGFAEQDLDGAISILRTNQIKVNECGAVLEQVEEKKEEELK